MVIVKETKSFQQIEGVEGNYTDYPDNEVWVVSDSSELAQKIKKYPSDFWSPVEENEELIDIEIDEEAYNAAINQENIKQSNEELKIALFKEDYKIIKCMEYYLISLSDEEKDNLPYDINTLHLKRQGYRDSIQE